MEEFIDEKSAKAKGKRVTTLEVAKIEDITPEPPEPEEPEEPEDLDEPDLSDEAEATESTEETTSSTPETLDIDCVPMTIEQPSDTQLDLF